MVSTDGLRLVDRAYVLFASSLQERDRPTDAQVRAEISMMLLAYHGDASRCVERVATEAGDHPHEYQRRMRWALATAEHAYRPALLLAS
jgi:hypothetical protein